MELWDLYDRQGEKTGETVVRGQMLPNERYHLVSCIVIRHTDGGFLLLRRSPYKENFPNILEIGVGGCVMSGETAQECAAREVEEETGIVCQNLTYTGRYIEGKSIYEGFLCITDIPKHQIRLQKEENSQFLWLTKEEFIEFFDSTECLDRFKNRLKDYVNTLR